jgi:hypothetical protein
MDAHAGSHTRTWFVIGSAIMLIGWTSAAPLRAQVSTRHHEGVGSAESSKLAVARKLRSLMVVESTIGALNHPAPFKPTTPSGEETSRAIERWSRRYMPADTLAEVEARAIANEFSESELRELVAFFSSPLGHRLVEAQPRLSKAVTAETNRIMAPHRQELIDTVRAIAAHGRPR